MKKSPAICDYEGSAYRTEFWVQEREYEDAVERVAMQALLPPTGRRLIEVGAGFGRLTDLYAGYDEVVLMDYARSQLLQARELWGDAAPGGRPRYRYVLADFYDLPFAAGLFDTVVMVRTLHHAADGPTVLNGVSRTLAPAGSFVLEFANKHNLKAILRYIFRRQDWNPFTLEPVEFVELNFDFHPKTVQTWLKNLDFQVQRYLTVSHFRLDIIKRLVPLKLLVGMDSLLQHTGNLIQLSPSVFVRAQAVGGPQRVDGNAFFRCPACKHALPNIGNGHLECSNCGSRWGIQDGIYNFKESLK